MKTKRSRKPRGVKLDGTRSLDMCECCLAFNCDPATRSRAWDNKLTQRFQAKVCPSCGSDLCRCKSSLSLPARNLLRQAYRGSHKNCASCSRKKTAGCFIYRKNPGAEYPADKVCINWRRGIGEAK